jgi:dienelactone hydrolase
MDTTDKPPNDQAIRGRTYRLITAITLGSLIASATFTVSASPALAARPAPVPITSTAPIAPFAPVGSIARAADAAQLALPAPTGHYRVGKDTLHLVDPDRADPWVPTERRELMVSLWYPTARPGGALAPYMTADESRLFLEGISGVPQDALTTVRTHAYLGARVLPRSHRLPLVLLSPGFGNPRSTLTGLAEDLASHGYVVAGIDHTYESVAVSFPDGRVTTCLICDQDVDGPAVTASRSRDVSFVLDQLLEHPAAWAGAGSIDPQRIAMAGHSIGGASALSAMLADRRIDAGANLDGTFFPALDRPFRRPFLMISGEEHGPGSDPSWTDTWRHLHGWKRWLSVTGTTHSSFTDIAVLADQIGQPIQPLPGERASEITRAYLVAFLDLHLRGQRQLLLDKPSARYPEVVFQNP